MSVRREEYLQALAVEFKRSCHMLSLPENDLLRLERLSEGDLEKRNTFIKQNFEHAYKNLKEGEYCLAPSVFGVNYFNLIINVDGKIKKITGAFKEEHVELQQYDGLLIKSNGLKECVERALLFFEKQGAIPILYEAHRKDVLNCVQNILETSIENNNFVKMKAAFDNLHLKEIDKAILLRAFSKASREIVTFLADKIIHHQLRLRQTSTQEHHIKEKVDQLLLIARKRVAVGDEENALVGECIRDYVKKIYPDRFTDYRLQEEIKNDEFFKLMAELSSLRATEQDFVKKRNLLEQKINKIINDIECDINIPVGIDRINPLDVALSKGSVALVKTLLQKGAEPTVGFKYETVDSFKKGVHSPLRYILNQSNRTKEEKDEIYQVLEKDLLERDQKTVPDKLSESTAFILVEEFVVMPKTRDHKPTRHL